MPVENLLACYDLKQAILQWVDRSHEQHRQRFWSVELGYGRWTFVMSQQLRDVCYKWLMTQTHGVKEVITRLQGRTTEWLQHYRPISLNLAIQLVEYHPMACPSPSTFFLSPPILILR